MLATPNDRDLKFAATGRAYAQDEPLVGRHDARNGERHDCNVLILSIGKSERGFAAMDDQEQRNIARGRVNRVGDQRTPDGGHIVFYTVEQQGQAVGYIVYLNPQGKVVKVE